MGTLGPYRNGICLETRFAVGCETNSVIAVVTVIIDRFVRRCKYHLCKYNTVFTW